jgi:hypothetical protein
MYDPPEDRHRDPGVLDDLARLRHAIEAAIVSLKLERGVPDELIRELLAEEFRRGIGRVAEIGGLP